MTIYDNYIASLNHNSNKGLQPDNCFKITHLRLFKILLPLIKDKSLPNHGFLAIWLLEICLNYLSQACVQEESRFKYKIWDEFNNFREFFLLIEGTYNE
jgi:hypothetical protein